MYLRSVFDFLAIGRMSLTYEGGLVGGKMHGSGLLSLDDKHTRFEGEFVDGIRHGKYMLMRGMRL